VALLCILGHHLYAGKIGKNLKIRSLIIIFIMWVNENCKIASVRIYKEKREGKKPKGRKGKGRRRKKKPEAEAFRNLDE
jgi:hypothetical protein